MSKLFKITVSVGWWWQLILTVPFTVVSLFTLFAVFQGSKDALCGFLFFAGPFTLLGWSLALYNIQLTEESVTVNTLYGRFRIAWDEVERILVKDRRIALLGRDKWVVLSPDSTSRNVKKMIEFINQKMEQKNMKAEEDAHFPLTHRNSRVRQ
jgi:hypothetical protein